MSRNQSRAEKSEAQLGKPGRSGSSSQQQRSYFATKGGGGTPPLASSSSANKSFKKSSNGQRGQSRAAFTVANSEPTVAVTASHSVQNASHAQSQLPDAPVSGTPRPMDSSIPRSPQGLPKAPPSQSTARALDSTAPTIQSKGNISGPFPFQFGSISPGFMNEMQIPARTSSAPPNLDEQKRDQALPNSFRTAPTAPVPSAPKRQHQQQHQLRKNIGTLNQSNTAGSHLPESVKREAHVQTPIAPAAATTQKSSILPVSGMLMPINFRPPQVPLQFGGPTSQIQAQGITPSSLQIPMPLPVGNASKVQQQVFVPGFQSHRLQPQGLVHQGQSLGFAPQISHQLIPQLSNLGIGMPPQFPQQQAGNFGGSRITVKITHPETHEELKLNKRTESYMDVGSSVPRSHPNVPAQSQPITSFPANYYPHMQPNPYNPSFLFPTSTSLPLTSTHMNPVSLASGYNYTVGQGVQDISFMNPYALNPLPFSKIGNPVPGKSEPRKLEHIHDSEIGSENCVQQPKSAPESLGSIPLPATLKHSPLVVVSTQGVSPTPSASLATFMPADESASALTNAESRRSESVKRSNSLKEQQKKLSKKEVCHFQQQQADLIDTAGSLKSPLLEMSDDSSFSDLNDDQGCTNPDDNVVLASSEAVGILLTTSMEPSFSSSLEHNCCSIVVAVSESEEAKTISSKSETSGVIFGRATKVSQGLPSSWNAAKTMIDGIQVGQGSSCEQSCPLDFKIDEAPSGNSDASGHVKQDATAPLKVGLKEEITVAMEHRKTESSDYPPKDFGDLTGGSAVSESYEPKEISQSGKGTVNMQETDVDESRCTKIEHFDMNVEAMGCSSEVNRTNGSLVQSASTPSGSMHAEIALSPVADFHEGKTSSADVSKILSGKSTAAQEEVALTDSCILIQETAHAALSVSTEATWKLEGRGIDSSSGSQVSTSLLASKDRISVEQNNAEGTVVKKKKKREILKKADIAGRTSDLYMAYKGPEEKHEIPVSLECKESSPAADVKQASTDNTEKGAVATEDEGKSKGEVDDWEDAAETSTPKLKALENREQLRVAQKQSNEYESGITGKKKYSRDFLLTFSELCTYLPADFEARSDLVDALMSRQGAASHLVGRESYPNTGRIVDRPMGGSCADRRGIGIMEDDRWSRAPGPFSAGRNPRLDVGFGDAGVSFRPGQGGNHGFSRNPRWQPGQYGNGILAGPMQSLASPGGMARSSPNADRWQRATGSQRGLIPSPKTPIQVMHRADKRYEVGKVSDEEEAKQRKLKGILNKLTPQNFDKLFKQVKAFNIDNTTTLTGVISQIFDKALTEPTFCEMYANFCFHLATALPDISSGNEKVTFKGLLLNKCQEEFERGEREEAEANRDDEEGEIKWSEEEKEQKKVQARRRMLGNIRLIGELYKKKMLTERIMHICIKKLLGQYQNPDEEDIEALCKLMSTIGEMIDHPKAKEHMDSYFNTMLNLSNNEELSSRVRFMLKDAIDLRNNRWQQRRIVEGPKKIEEVHRDAAQERQAQVTRLSRGSAAGSSAKRGRPLNYGAQGSTTLSSLSSQQRGALRGSSPQFRGHGTQDVRTGDRHPFENRIPSVTLPQRPVDNNYITLGPQGGLARGMTSRGQPLLSNAPLADTSSGHYGSRRMVSDQNGYSSVSDWTSYDNSREKLMPRSGATTPAAVPTQGISTGSQNALSESKVSMERLRDLSISAIREYYCARNEEEVRLCVKELNDPNFYPDMVMLWVTDSFDRKNDVDRDLLAKLLVNLCMSQESLLYQVHLIKGFESVLSSLEDVVTDFPKAAEYLGCILGMVISENALSLREIGRLIQDGGEKPGSLLDSGLASDVLVSVLRTLRREKGDSVLNEMRTSSNLCLEDFRSPDPLKSRKLDAFI